MSARPPQKAQNAWPKLQPSANKLTNQEQIEEEKQRLVPKVLCAQQSEIPVAFAGFARIPSIT
ncbi:hypothetical protein ACNR90_001727 [Candidozyma auris]